MDEKTQKQKWIDETKWEINYHKQKLEESEYKLKLLKL